MTTATPIVPGLSSQQLRDLLDNDHESYKLLAKVVCSTYFGRVGVDLRELGSLDSDNFSVAVSIMSYRRQKGWSDDAFYSFACWCRVRHGLKGYPQ